MLMNRKGQRNTMSPAERVWSGKSDVVCVHKLELNGEATLEDFARGGYEMLRAMLPDPQDRRVLMKPNVTIPAEPDSGIITHSTFVGGLVDYFLEIGVPNEEILVGEGVHGSDQHWRTGGYLAMAEEKRIPLLDTDSDELVRVPVEEGDFFEDIGLPKTGMDPETYLISVPKMKTHNLAVTTFCTKNMQGMVRAGERHLCGLSPEESERREEVLPSGITFHEDRWAQKICDVHSVVKPLLNIIEGIVGRDGTGFHRGSNLNTGLVVAGASSFSVDAVASHLVGFDPTQIGYLIKAKERGLWDHRLEDIAVYEVVDSTLEPCEDLGKYVYERPFEVIGWK